MHTKIFVGKPEGKRPLGRPRLRWEDNIKMDLMDRMECVDLIHLAHDRDMWRALVNTVRNIPVLYEAGNFLTSSATNIFSRRTKFRGN
jgi:hypothetical protein